MAARYCPSCGAPALADDVFCGHCGAALRTLAGQADPATPAGATGSLGGARQPAAIPASLSYAYAAGSAPGSVPARVAAPVAPAGPPVAASGGRAFGATVGVLVLALLVMLFQIALRAGATRTARGGDDLLASLLPVPLAIIVTFWLGAVLLAFTSRVRSWLTAICLAELLFGVAALIQTGAFALYLRRAELLPTMTLGATRGQVLTLTVIHTLLACVLGIAFAEALAPWDALRVRGRRGSWRWAAVALVGGVVALLTLQVVHGSILRLTAADLLGVGARWEMDAWLTALVVMLCAILGGAVGWSLARETR